MSGKKRKFRLQFADAELDLVPLIDCVFLLLLFFMLCGRMSTDNRTEQITVPPTKTANKFDPQPGWERLVVNVYGSTQNKPGAKATPRNSIAVPPRPPWITAGIDDYTGYQKLREVLNNVYDKAPKYDDPKTKGVMKLPKVIVEIRADGDTEYRVVQEIQQVLTDSIDPFNNMLPRQGVKPENMKPFVVIDFTSRRPGEKS
jgi:biopolymer transport protein ExbD